MGIRNNKHIIISILLVVAVCIVAEVCGNIYISHRMSKKRQAELEGIVSVIREKYPEISDTEIVESLQGKTGDSESGRQLLADYGYDEEYYKLNMREYRHDILMWNCVVAAFALVVVGLLWLAYGRRYKARVSEITDYLHDMRNGDYRLWADSALNSDMKAAAGSDEYAEDELSLLRNEVYKTTVLLKETSEYQTKLNEDLSRSMEDVSHQLRTPLASMTIMLDNIYDDPDMPPDVRQDFIHSISMQVTWMSSLVNSMLKLARFDAGVIKLKEGDIDVKKLIGDCLDKLSVIIELKGVEVIVGEINASSSGKQQIADSDVSGDGCVKTENPMVFCGDYAWQLEAITNIVKNAVEHSRQGGRVWIEASQNSVYTQISIRDEGEGMSAEDAKHIFERFYHAGNSDKESIGIGLSLSKSIVEADNGYIRVESTPDEGTEFLIKYLRKLYNA